MAAKTTLLISYDKVNSCILRIHLLQNEPQRSVNNFWSRILDNLCGAWSQISVNHELAAVIGRWVRDVCATASQTFTNWFIFKAVIQCSWGFWPMKAVKTLYIDSHSHNALWITMMRGRTLLMLCLGSFSRLGRERDVFSRADKGSKYSDYV